MKEAVRFAVFLGVLIVSILILGSVGVVGFIVAMVVGFALGGWVYDELLPSIWTTVSKANKTGQTTGQPSFANSSVQHEDAHRDFLVRSYDKWREGKFDFLSGDYRKKTSDHASGTLAVNLLGEKEFCDFLSLCLRARAPNPEELMVTLSPGDFMLTNENLYLTTDAKTDSLRAISLCQIVSYTNSGVWMKRAEFGLAEAQPCHVKLEAVPARIFNLMFDIPTFQRP